MISLVFKATADQLFGAWTDPAIMSRWLFKGNDSDIANIDADVSVGGYFSIAERTREGTTEHTGNYLLVDKPNALAFTLEVPKHFAGTSQVSLEFKQSDVGCEMMFQQTGIDPNIAEAEWRRMFSNLTMVLLGR
jgi:uncharacterized protein YndB with AHSA1/START domain